MKKVLCGVVVLALWASPSWAAGLKLTFGNGNVSVDAQDVTIRQILAEWARLGKTRIVNLEGVASGLMTLTLENVPENVALDIILRAVPGYMAAQRADNVPNASRYDRILIVPTTTAVVARPAQASGMPTAFPPPPSPNVTQLRSPGYLVPGVMPDPADFPDQQDDPAITAAAAAGLITVSAPTPGGTPQNPGMRTPLIDPFAPTPAPTPTPSNPWNVSTGASVPGLAPPAPPPATTPATGVRRPPQADR